MTNQFVMPDLTGMYWPEAEQVLRKAGWTGPLTRGPGVHGPPADLDRIVAQIPPAGSMAWEFEVITLQFGAGDSVLERPPGP